MCVQDFKTLIEDDEEMKERLMKKSLDHFVSQEENVFQYCPTPDCGGIYPSMDTQEINEKLVYHCLDCGCDICTR